MSPFLRPSIFFLLSLIATSNGCGQAPPLAPGTSSDFSIESGGRTRHFIVHLPSKYSQNKAAPLILSFHGSGLTGEYQQRLSQFDNEKWNPNAIAVYPQGFDGAWQGAPYADPSINDKSFVDALLDHMEAKYCIDKKRIYASGKSLGGGFCNVLACSPSISHRFAAFAPVAGAFYTGLAANGSDCHPAKSVTPILEFHGLADETINYNGGLHNGVNMLPILVWTSRWAKRSGCSGTPIITSLKGGKVKHYNYGCSTEHYAIADLAHYWPSKDANPDNAAGTYIDATPIIMDFFNHHSK